MDYTVNLKKILSEKQFAFLQSISASLRTMMSPELFNHSVGTFNYCFKIAERFLLNAAGASFEDLNTAASIKEDTNASGNDAKYLTSKRKRGLKDFTSGRVFEDPGTGPGINSQEKKIPDICFDLAVAAMLHDYGKIFSFEELKAIALKEKLRISDFELSCEPILHGFVAPFLIKRDFKIKDRDVLNMVRIHTTGSVKMRLTDKILYIADKIEETRDYEGVEKLRHLSLEDINLCLLEVYKSNIIYVIKGNSVLHPDTAKIWNYIHGGLKNAI